MAFFQKNNLPRIKDGAYAINFDDKKLGHKKLGTYWVSLFINRNTAVYFDPFGIEYNPQEVLNNIKDKSVTHSVIQDNESSMSGFSCITFIEYMLAGKTLLDYTNLFSLDDYKKNDKIIYKYFKEFIFKAEDASLKFRLRIIDETRNDLLEEIKQFFFFFFFLIGIHSMQG